MIKIYVQSNGFKMVGKAKDIRSKLKEYQQQYKTVDEFLQSNTSETKRSAYSFKHDDNSFTLITPPDKKTKRTLYYLLFPSKNM